MVFSGIFFIVVFFVIAVYVAILSHKTDLQEKKTWSEFAQATGLTFKPAAGLLDKAHVAGAYKKYYIKLDTTIRLEGDHSDLKTRFILRMDEPRFNTLAVFGKDGQEIARDYLTRLHGLSNDTVRSRLYLGWEGKHLVWRYEYPRLVRNVPFLRASLDHLVTLADDYATFIALGGEAIPPLQRAAEEKPALRFVLPHLLKEIERQSLDRTGKGERRLWCPHCQTRYVPIKVALPWTWLKSISYYGCRICGRSRDYLVGDVIGVLDAHMTEEVHRHNNHIRVNWLVGRRVFDFDQVEILQADDEAVERFAVQLGNDTDQQRQKRYGQMHCLVSPQSHLSENTLRILKRRFGQVTAKI